MAQATGYRKEFIDNLLEQIGELSSAQDTINNQWGDLVSSLEPNANKLEELNNVTLPALRNALDANQATLDELNETVIPELDSNITALGNSLSTLNNITLAELQESLNLNQDALDEFNTVTLPGLNSSLTELDGKFPITSVDISDSAITTPKLYAFAITAEKIAASAVTADAIAANAITAIKIDATAITGKTISGGTITGTVISGGTITGNTVSGGTVSGVAISGSTITGNTISGGTISGITISGSTITGNTISGGTISGIVISGSTITGNTISAGSITGTDISGGTITGSVLQTAVSGARIKISTGSTPMYQIFTGNAFEDVSTPAGMYMGSLSFPDATYTYTTLFNYLRSSKFNGDTAGKTGQLTLGSTQRFTTNVGTVSYRSLAQLSASEILLVADNPGYGTTSFTVNHDSATFNGVVNLAGGTGAGSLTAGTFRDSVDARIGTQSVVEIGKHIKTGTKQSGTMTANTVKTVSVTYSLDNAPTSVWAVISGVAAPDNFFISVGNITKNGFDIVCKRITGTASFDIVWGATDL